MARRDTLTRRRFIGTGAAVLLPTWRAHAMAEQVQLVVKEIAPGVFVHAPRVSLVSRDNRGDIANLAFVVGDEAVAVIDTGSTPAIGRALRAAIAKVTDRPVRFVINTHMHFDHAFGNAAFRGDGVAFIAHKNLPRALAARRDAYRTMLKQETGEATLADDDIVLSTTLVETETTIDLGNRPLQLRAWPAAHTDNDLTVLDVESATLFAGDLLFDAHVPVLDGSLAGWLKLVAALKTLPAKRVVPGHGAASLPWPDALAPQERYLARLAGDLRSAIAAGTPIGEAVATAARSERNNWRLFDDYNPRNATTAYGELEWE
jgi:quinoprotein relay system zinc metallohydrolase 2